jgi:SAM-dependent methyltransferase
MIFIQADGSLPLKVDIQSKRLSNMSQDNKNNINKYFDSKKKFDIITSMFAIHYLFDSQESINNLINNIKLYLNIGGFIVFTLFDAGRVSDLLGEKDVYTSYYTDENGEKQKLFEIIKKFQGPIKDEPGQSIDVNMRWISDVYYTENLITSKLMIKSMEKAGCKLVDSDLFANLYQINKGWFQNVISHEENVKNKEFYADVAKFYDELKGADKESKIFSFLNRYYIFQKIE